jgi:hypothetical protein
MNGWFIPKLGLAVAFLYWTIRFIYCDHIENNEGGGTGVDYFIELVRYLEADTATKKVRDIFLLIKFWSSTISL